MEGSPLSDDPTIFFSAEGPMVCFTAVSHEETFTETMGLIAQRDTVLQGCNVCMHVNPIAVAAGNSGVIYTALIRVPGRVRAFLLKIGKLGSIFAGNMLICDPLMTDQAFRVNGIPFKDNYFTVDSADALSVLLNMGMTDTQKQIIQQEIFLSPPGRGRRRARQRRGHRADWLPPQQLRNDRMEQRFFSDFLQGADARGRAAPIAMPTPDMMRGSGFVFHNHEGSVVGQQHVGGAMPFWGAEMGLMNVIGGGGERGGGLTEAEALALGQRISEQHAARTLSARRERNARDPRPDDLPIEWEKILKDPEPCAPGYPECRVCRAHKATILFPQCAHMVLCDGCVRRMFTDPGVASECPLCPGVRKTQIMRPTTAEVTDPEEEPTTSAVVKKARPRDKSAAAGSVKPRKRKKKRPKKTK